MSSFVWASSNICRSPTTRRTSILSNCVINLVPDKAQVFREAFRALKPGGRLAISDVVNKAPLPAELQGDPALLCGCIAGAATVARDRDLARRGGFVDVRVTPKAESRELISTWAPGSGIEDFVVSATIEARKPGGRRGMDERSTTSFSLHRQFGEEHPRRSADGALGRGVQGLQRRQLSEGRGACAGARAAAKAPTVEERLRSKSWDEFAAPARR